MHDFKNIESQVGELVASHPILMLRDRDLLPMREGWVVPDASPSPSLRGLPVSLLAGRHTTSVSPFLTKTPVIGLTARSAPVGAHLTCDIHKDRSSSEIPGTQIWGETLFNLVVSLL